MDKDKVTKAIYDMSDAKTASEVHEILSRFKAPPVSQEQIHENLEDVIQEAIQGLLDLLKKINLEEEKGAVVDAEDNNILEISESVMVPPPPGTIDPNETGIPDNSLKSNDVDYSEQIFHNPDHPPEILERPYPFQSGDYVSWEGSLSRSYGRIEDIRLTGAIEIADSPLSMFATYEDPVCLIRVWHIDNGGYGWLPGDTVVPVKMSALHKIDPLEPKPELAPALPHSGSKDLEGVISSKKLKVKAVGNQLRGSFRAEIKSVDSVDVSSYRLSKEDEGLIGAEEIPEGSIVRDIVAADLLEDRGSERFTDQSLDGLALGYPKKPMLLDHEWSAHQIVGKVIKAANRGGQLVLRSFFPNTPRNSWVVDNIKSNIFTMVSVGFAASPEDMVCSACKRSMFDSACKHQPGDILKDGSRVNLIYTNVADVFECSIVPVPMQPGAHIMSASHSLKNLIVSDGDPSMTYTTLEPLNIPPDTIALGTSTIGNSLKMSDNLANIAPVGTEGAVATTQDMGLMPAAAVDPPSTGTLQEPNKEATPDAPAAVEATKEATSGLGIEDVHKMVGELRTVSEGAYAEMCVKMDKLGSTADEINSKTGEILGTFKAVPSPEPTGELLKAMEAKFEALLKAQAEAFTASTSEYKTSLEALHKKLDVAMTVSTQSVLKLLEEENVQEPQRAIAKKNIWVHDFFGQKDDQGGQS